jgi:hypothetical protein
MPRQQPTRLAEGLRRRLIPEFKANGFVVVPLNEEERSSAELRRSFPLGRLHRYRGEKLDLVEIQLNRNNIHTFRLNVAKVPPRGIELKVGHLDQHQVWVYYLDTWFELYECPTLRLWFGCRWLPGAAITDERIDRAVGQATDLVPEVDALLNRGIVGRHIRRVA